MRPPLNAVIPDGEADPGSFSPYVHLRNGVPALRFASAGMTVVLVRFFIWTRFGDPSGPPNRFIQCVRAICRVKSRFPSEICRKAAQSGLDPSNRPRTIEYGLWGRHSLHQSLLEQSSYPRYHSQSGHSRPRPRTGESHKAPTLYVVSAAMTS